MKIYELMLSSLFEGISRDELIARMQEKREKAYIDKILSKMHELVQTDGDRQSLGGYAFDVGRMIGNAIHPKELEQMYRKKYMNESKINEWGRVVKGVNTTVDVGPNEIKTQAAKFGNSVTKDGVPPTTRTRVVKEEARYTAYEWSIIQGGHSLDDIKKPDPGLAIMEENFRIFSEKYAVEPDEVATLAENFAKDKKGGNVISPPGNTVGLNVFELSPEDRNKLNGTVVYHQTKKLNNILQSGGLRPRADTSGEREFALFDLRAGKDWRTPKGIFVSTKSGGWFGDEISFKIEPKDKIYRAYSDTGHLLIANPVNADRFISAGPIEENFADGKNPGRKGLAKRSGVNTKASVSSLRKTAKSSSGEKQRMAHWLANMKSGKSKAKKK